MSEKTLRADPADRSIEQINFVVTPVSHTGDSDQMCSNPFCDCDCESELTHQRILGGDFDGMAADYAELPFCSEECIEQFAQLGTLQDVEMERTGTSTIIPASDARTKVDAKL